MLIMWIALTLLAVLALVVFARGPNAVWGGCTIGLVIGIVIAVIGAVAGRGFGWAIAGKVTVAAVLIGACAELIGRAAARRRSRGS